MKKLSALIIAVLIIAGAARAGTLSLDSFIKTAIENNPSYKISAEEYLIAIEANKSAKSLEDWNLVASGVFQEANPAQMTSLSASYKKTASYSVGLNKYVARTGTAISLEHSNARVAADYSSAATAFNPASPYYVSSLSLSISQPLFKNAFGLATRNALQLSDYSLELAQLKLSEDWEDFITSLKADYLTWQKCHLNLAVYQDKVKTVENQIDLVKKQLRYGLSENLDLVQIEQKLQAYKIMLEQAKMACETQTRKILLSMGQFDA
ncbi:MAG: TolC family protein, partial [Candidatus Margulisiibacteriota bacterium]